ncbi:MAG: tRNA (N(6)-L-threonylcarbamoyladenosine(37)-C(2))-methylthiotransferase MtaB [Proteobacteria bacterium]|nr:tRNA (N(6)-L-threonylcarbamoyladenosine(37)-C(2))-methylthiotransferase MtaB [Pseudomonadota bacterium]
MNSYDTALLWEGLEEKGYKVSDKVDVADVYIVNTCTVTNSANSQSRQIARKVKKLNPKALVIVTGCYAQVNPDEVSKLECVDYVVGNQEKDQILKLVENAGPEQEEKVIVGNISKAKSLNYTKLTGFQRKNRAFLRVQDGCDAFCAYCIIPYARGRSRSLSMEEIEDQVLSLSERGYAEIVLTGIHLGGYGLDLPPNKSFLSLLKKLDDLNIDSRFRISSIEPTEIDDEMIEFLITSKKICRHLHIPLQSGDEEILKKMGRKYSPSFYMEKIDQIASKWHDVAIGVDVIVGFPGEHDDNFINSYNLIKNIEASYLHVFPYSIRQGTPAATMPDHVAPNIIKSRSALMRELGSEKKRAFCRRFLGKRLNTVKVDEKVDGIKALSDNYIEININNRNVEETAIINAEIERIDAGVCYGKVVV